MGEEESAIERLCLNCEAEYWGKEEDYLCEPCRKEILIDNRGKKISKEKFIEKYLPAMKGAMG